MDQNHFRAHALRLRTMIYSPGLPAHSARVVTAGSIRLARRPVTWPANSANTPRDAATSAIIIPRVGAGRRIWEDRIIEIDSALAPPKTVFMRINRVWRLSAYATTYLFKEDLKQSTRSTPAPPDMDGSLSWRRRW
jgi:hypothetical protein